MSEGRKQTREERLRHPAIIILKVIHLAFMAEDMDEKQRRVCVLSLCLVFDSPGQRRFRGLQLVAFRVMIRVTRRGFKPSGDLVEEEVVVLHVFKHLS